MPTADDHRPRPSEEPEPAGGDPFEGLVLDEDFVRGAAVKEPTARTRMLSARWRLEEPVDPGGRRWSPRSSGPPRIRRLRHRRLYLLSAVFAVVSFAALALGPGDALDFGGRSSRSGTADSRPAADVALPGGGTSDGGRCGAEGFHHFTPPAASPVSGAPDGQPGPQLALGGYGFMKTSAADPGHFTIGLLLAPGRHGPMDLSAPLGVAVEIEGTDGLVGGAYNLPVTFDDTALHTADGRIRTDPEGGTTAEVTLPAAALCPGFDGLAVQQHLAPPADSRNTITGQPRYTLTVSISDPAIGALRQASGSTVRGDVLSADNLMPHDEAIRAATQRQGTAA